MARVRITNAHDLLRAARGEIRAASVHRLESDALTDDGAATLVLSDAHRRALGLAVRGSRRVLYSDGREADLPSTGSVILEVAGRRILCEALVEPGRTVPLVGGSGPEALDLAADPMNPTDVRAVAPAVGASRADEPPPPPFNSILKRVRDLFRQPARKPWGRDRGMSMSSRHGPAQLDCGSARRRHGAHFDGPPERSRRMNGIDETIERVETLYRSLTGREPPANGGLGIPPEKDPSQHVTEQVERLLGALASSARPTAVAVSPSLSVWESSTETRICVEMPGATRESVRLSVTNNALAVSATQAPADEGFTLRLSEHPSGEFHRTIPLPTGVSEDDIRAQMRDGILEITLPRRCTAAPSAKPIPIA